MMSIHTVLISGAGIAGPVLAFWLRRHGFEPVVVERAARLRGGRGGHGVDLWPPALQIVDRMGLRDAVDGQRTGLHTVRIEHPGHRPATIDFGRLIADVTTDHIEVFRGALAELIHDATRHAVRYRFSDSIATLEQRPDAVSVTFESGASETYDLVIGADGLHSRVRDLAFGPEGRYLRPLGGYLATFSFTGSAPAGQMRMFQSADLLTAVYPVHDTGVLRALFLFRSAPLDYPYRDLDRQRRLLRGLFADRGWEIPRLLDAADRAQDLYLDSISQVHLDRWYTGRVGLVGDAGYSPAPAVGGGTTVAVVGAYLLARSLAEHRGDPAAAFAAYEHRMRPYVRASFGLGPRYLRRLAPTTRVGAVATLWAAHVMTALPAAVRRRLLARDDSASKVLAAVDLDR